MSDYYGVQVSAAGALATLVHKRAVPPIEQQLSNSTDAVRGDLLDIIVKLDGGFDDVRETADSAYLLTVWHRLMQSKMDDVRKYATKAVITREPAPYVLAHSELLDDPDDMIRYYAVRALAERGDARAVTLLRKALRDNNGSTRT